jgi:hypothetical protein
MERVRLWVRHLTSEEPWQALDMTVDGDHYVAQVPLTAAGLQYSFEAVDAWGNRSRAPDFTTMTPYLLLLPSLDRKSGGPLLDPSPQIVR